MIGAIGIEATKKDETRENNSNNKASKDRLPDKKNLENSLLEVRAQLEKIPENSKNLKFHGRNF